MEIFKVQVSDVIGTVVAEFGYYDDYDEANTRKMYVMSKASKYLGKFEVITIFVNESIKIAKPIEKEFYQLK